ncbi:hypothetical protein B0J11DRAFT_509603 [Dendryphion nanum]|uniref:Arrestin-like N-terminal domain-containing protein n=1 Tax=Dendryphion nanum TaxID=256645 RepID=A0A9P9DFQ2_9PLEO|nr:hypothetical protein B0J11DRAFT_509603 [Dendryphion nanum]
MAVASRESHILHSFPKPPLGTPSPRFSRVPSPKRDTTIAAQYRASDFGFIQVALDTASLDNDSLYEDPEPFEKHQSMAALVIDSEPNLGDLQLVLDSSSRLYAPGETITGYVSGWDQFSHVHIILEGRAKSCIRNEKAEFKDHAPLLYQVTHLSPQVSGMIPRFSVTIPETTQGGLASLDDFAPYDQDFTRYWTHDWPSQESYECEPGHPLPPSMTMPLQPSHVLTSRAAGRGHIEYNLLAIRSRRNRVTGKLVPEAGCTTPVFLTTQRLTQSKVLELTSQKQSTTTHLEVQTSQLSKISRLSLREQVWDAFNSSNPSFYFAPHITTPELAVPGSDVKIAISISIMPPPPGKLYNFPVPDVSVVGFACRVRSYTGIRVLRTSSAAASPSPKPTQSKAHTFKACELRTSSTPPKAVFVPKDGAFENQACVISITLPKTVLPSFKTFNFWRSYRIECDVTFRVAGKEVTAHTESDLNIVARFAGTVEDGTPSARMEGEDEEGLGIAMAKEVVRASAPAGWT